ncbi:MAG: hypothetical protein ACOY9Y_09150 [Bacillota bacterium]
MKAAATTKGQKSFDLQRYFQDLFACSGAVSDTPGYALVEALLPPETAKDLEIPAHVVLAFDYEAAAEASGAEFVTFGSPLLDKALSLGKTFGKVAKKYMVQENPKIPPGMMERIEKKIDLTEYRRHSLLTSSLIRCEHILFNFMVRFFSDEKQEARYSVFIDTVAGRDASYQIPWLSGIFCAESGESLTAIPAGDHCGYARAYELAKASLPKAIAKDLEDFQKRMAGYLGGEVKRLQAYYRGTKEEIERRLVKVAPGDPKGKTLEQKLAAADVDFRARVDDLHKKYQVAVEAELDSITVYVVPKVRNRIMLQHRTHSPILEVYYNLAANQVELPYCPGCREPFATIHMAKDGSLCCHACAKE